MKISKKLQGRKSHFSSEEKQYIKDVHNKYKLLTEDEEMLIIKNYNIKKIALYQAIIENNLSKSLLIELLDNILESKEKRAFNKGLQTYTKVEAKAWLAYLGKYDVDKGLLDQALKINPLMIIALKCQENAEISLLVKDIQQLQQKMIGSNFKLILKVAGSFRNNSLSIMDLTHYGIDGIIVALDKYDYYHNNQKNNRFSTMAISWIRHAINRTITNKKDLVRFPVHITENYQKIRKVIDKNQLTGIYMSEEQICSKIGLSHHEYYEAMSSKSTYASIDYTDNENSKYENMLEAENDSYKNEYEERERKNNMEKFFTVIVERSKNSKMPINEKDIYLLQNHPDFNESELNNESISKILKCSKQSIVNWVDDLKKKMRQPQIRDIALEFFE